MSDGITVIEFLYENSVTSLPYFCLLIFTLIFGPIRPYSEACTAFCDRLGVDFMIRSHEVCGSGCQYR
jgi:hypothetical protein